MSTNLADLYLFSTVATGCLFTASLIFKVRNFPQFLKTIDRFQLLPQFLTLPTAVMIIAAEVIVLVSLIKCRLLAFSLSSSLLLVFTIAFCTLLTRRIQISCNCFGGQQHPVTLLEILRNSGFLFCSFWGFWLSTKPSLTVSSPSEDSSVVCLTAISFTLIWMHIGEIYRAFQPNKLIN